jgi:RNA 2',3'-cyclic 3'-phosphodiesterase
MRLFVAITLPSGAAEAVRRMPRPDVSPVRWTTPEQWHVTLRFIGEVSDPAAVSEALIGLAAARGTNPTAVQAVMGPASAWFPGRSVLQVPVAGLDDLAETVAGLTSPWERRPGHETFNGHLTLARVRGKATGPTELAGIPVTAQWPVDQVTLYSSVLGSPGAVYDALTVVDL